MILLWAALVSLAIAVSLTRDSPLTRGRQPNAVAVVAAMAWSCGVVFALGFCAWVGVS